MTDTRWRFVPLPAPHAFRVESPNGGSPGELHGLEADSFIAWVRELEEEASLGAPTQDEIEDMCVGTCAVVDELEESVQAIEHELNDIAAERRQLLTDLRLLLRVKSLDELKRGMIQRLEEEDPRI